MQTPQAMAYGQTWGGAGDSRDCSRFYHYPYVFYPQNYRGSEYYQSSDSMYNRYPPEMQIPVYNRHWHNYYPSSRRYHWGHHFHLGRVLEEFFCHEGFLRNAACSAMARRSSRCCVCVSSSPGT